MRNFLILLALYVTIITCFITCRAGTAGQQEPAGQTAQQVHHGTDTSPQSAARL